MGFSDLQAKNALLKTGNSNAEAAIQYILENMDDPDLNAPIGGGAPEADSESIVMLSSMGFEADRAALALSKCDGSIERALEWLFSH